jgi:hypothetical protein
MADDKKDGNKPPPRGPMPSAPVSRSLWWQKYVYSQSEEPPAKAQEQPSSLPHRNTYVPDLARQGERPSEKATVAEDKSQSGTRKAFSLSRDDALFWIGVAVFGDGLYLVAEHPMYAVPLITAGVALLAWSNRGHMPKPRLRLAALILAMAITCGIAGYDLYERHFGNPLAPPQEVPAVRTNSTPLSPERWPALTSTETSVFVAGARLIPPQDIVVVCENINCKDLTDGIGEILLKTPGWKVQLKHDGGIGISCGCDGEVA